MKITIEVDDIDNAIPLLRDYMDYRGSLNVKGDCSFHYMNEKGMVKIGERICHN